MRMVACAVTKLVFEIETNKVNNILMVINRISNTKFSITVQIASWEMLSVSDLFVIKNTEFPLYLHILPAIFLIFIC